MDGNSEELTEAQDRAGVNENGGEDEAERAKEAEEDGADHVRGPQEGDVNGIGEENEEMVEGHTGNTPGEESKIEENVSEENDDSKKEENDDSKKEENNDSKKEENDDSKKEEKPDHTQDSGITEDITKEGREKVNEGDVTGTADNDGDNDTQVGSLLSTTGLNMI